MSEKTVNDAKTGDVVTLYGTRWTVIGFLDRPAALLEREGSEHTLVNERTHHTVTIGSEHASEFKLVDPAKGVEPFVAPTPLPMETFEQHYSRTVLAMEEHYNRFLAATGIGKIHNSEGR